MRAGAYRAAHRSSDAARGRRAHVAVRAALVSSRTKYISLARALLRQEGCRVGSGSAGTFSKRVQAQELPEAVRVRIAPLLTAMTGLNEQLAALDKELASIVRADAVAHRLCTVPGIGPVTAVTFEAVVDQVTRFGSAKEVRAYVGLVPRERSSGSSACAATLPRRAMRGCGRCSSRRPGASCATSTTRRGPCATGPCASPCAAVNASPP